MDRELNARLLNLLICIDQTHFPAYDAKLTRTLRACMKLQEAGAQMLSWNLSLPESGRLKFSLTFVRLPHRPGIACRNAKGSLGGIADHRKYTNTYSPSTVFGLAWSEMRGAWSLLGQRLASAWSEMRWGSVTVWTTVGQRLDKMGRD